MTRRNDEGTHLWVHDFTTGGSRAIVLPGALRHPFLTPRGDLLMVERDAARGRHLIRRLALGGDAPAMAMIADTDLGLLSPIAVETAGGEEVWAICGPVVAGARVDPVPNRFLGRVEGGSVTPLEGAAFSTLSRISPYGPDAFIGVSRLIRAPDGQGGWRTASESRTEGEVVVIRREGAGIAAEHRHASPHRISAATSVEALGGGPLVALLEYDFRDYRLPLGGRVSVGDLATGVRTFAVDVARPSEVGPPFLLSFEGSPALGYFAAAADGDRKGVMLNVVSLSESGRLTVEVRADHDQRRRGT